MRSRKVVLCIHRDPVILSTLCVAIDCWGYRPIKSLDVQLSPAAVVTDRPDQKSIERVSFPNQFNPAAIILYGPEKRFNAISDARVCNMAELREQLRISTQRKRGPRSSGKKGASTTEVRPEESAGVVRAA